MLPHVVTPDLGSVRLTVLSPVTVEQ
jgi:hypothetical protein